MAGRVKRSPRVREQGAALSELVVEQEKFTPHCICSCYGNRSLTEALPLPPALLERLTFPSGKPLPPSLKRWLAFDGTWLRDLGWFSSLDQAAFAPRRLYEIVEEEF